MSNFNRLQSGTAVLIALSMVAGAATPLVIPAPAFAQTTFSDVSSNYWAKEFIAALSERGIIAGFPDGSFRPEAPVTRAQFATILSKAFDQNAIREPLNFADVPSNYWAANAIQEAYTTGFVTGYPGRVFRPNQNISRAQVLVSLASGLNYSSGLPVDSVLQYYRDGLDVPNYARDRIAAATERGIVVNYPNTELLQPNKIATRAEVAAFIYQALVNTGAIAAIPSPYIVTLNTSPPRRLLTSTVRIPAGTVIPVFYSDAERIIVAPNEPAPIPLALTVAQDIVAADQTLLIPAGSQVMGELIAVEPEQGAQFFTRQLTLANGQAFLLRAKSPLIKKTVTIAREPNTNVGNLTRNAALGVVAAAAVTALTGGTFGIGQVLLGAGYGGFLGLFTNRDRVELISIQPEMDLPLTLTSDLTLRP